MDEEIEKKFSEHSRRFSDKLKDCREDVNVELDTIAKSMAKMQADIQAMKEILEAWNNMKGFASGVSFIATVIKVLAPVVAFFGGLYWLIHTGSWPNGK